MTRVLFGRSRSAGARVLSAVFLGAGCILGPAAANGQEAPSGLEEIVVTATRRDLVLSDVPLAMSVLSERDIKESGFRAFRDYLSSIPGVAFSDVGLTDAKITVRGISTDIWSEVRDLTAVYLDETPITQPGTHFIVQSSINPYLVDVRRVELLRGPQGTLFGANSMGGTLRIVTNRPDPSGFASFAEGTVETIEHGGQTYAVNGMVNLPVGDASALRVVGYYEDFGGYIDNVGTGREDVDAAELVGGRLAAAIPFNERLSIELNVMHQERRTDGLNLVNISLPAYLHTTQLDEFYDDDWTVYNAVLKFEFAIADVTSSTSFVDRYWRQVNDISGFLEFFDVATGTVTADNAQDQQEFTQEVRLTSNANGRVEWLLGLFFVDRNLALRQSFPAPGFDEATNGAATDAGAPDNLSIGGTEFDHQHFAVYGEVAVDLADDWSLSLGGRGFYFDESSLTAFRGFLAGGIHAPHKKSSDETGFVPKVTLSWTPSAQTLLYATASQGFRPGGPNWGDASLPDCQSGLDAMGLEKAPEFYESDSLWNYEIGMRSTLLDGRLQASTAVFRMDWSDVQILAFLSCGAGFLFNAAAARSDGVEAELEFQPSDSVTLELSGAYVDARLTRDVPELNVESGEELPGVPELSLQAAATWRFPLGSDTDGFVRGDYRFVDETGGSFVPEASVRLTAPSYDVVDLRFGVEREGWNASLYVTNVFDEYGIVNRVDDFGFHPGGDFQNLIQPRTVGLSLRARFE